VIFTLPKVFDCVLGIIGQVIHQPSVLMPGILGVVKDFI
jgi:hypothetical protein